MKWYLYKLVKQLFDTPEQFNLKIFIELVTNCNQLGKQIIGIG